MSNYADLIERLESYRPTNEWGDPVHHAIIDEAAACIREMVEWRPIETAPRDGTMFLVGYDGKVARKARLEAHQRVYEARWCERQQSFAARNGFILHDGATHWLPLPPAPGAEA